MRGKVIRFPVERCESYIGYEKDRWFRDAVTELVNNIDLYFDTYDIFTGRPKEPPGKK